MKEKKKNAKFVVNENHSLRGTHDGQKYFNGPNQNMPFNILPNKTKKVKNRSKVNNQSGFQNKITNNRLLQKKTNMETK